MEGTFPEEGTCKGDKEEEGQETYAKLSVIHATKRDT